jgi:hypothetical protein
MLLAPQRRMSTPPKIGPRLEQEEGRMISIEDRMAILDLCSEYNYYIDTGAAERWADTFTADGVFDGAVGRAEGRGALVEFARQFGSDYPGAMHFTDNHLFEPDGDAMKHKCFLSFQVPTEDSTNLILVGYQDELVKIDGAWKFRIRQVGPLNKSVL